MKCKLFARLFSNEEFKKSFLDGKLWFSSLGYFKALEDEYNTKGDRLEGVSSYLQPEKIELVLSHGDVNHKITGLVGAITIENPEYRSLKIYCLYSPELNISDIDGNSYQILPTNQMIQDFGNQLIWIHDIQEFRRRVEAEIEKNADLIKHYKGNSVVYFDHQHHGHFDQNNVPFRKHQKFSFQKEFRIVLKTMDDSESPFVLDIGDIRDICTEMDASDFDENKMEISILQNSVH